MTPDRYDAAIANIRDTVKWLIGSIGAVFVTLLAGVQFNHVPFTTDCTTAAVGIVAALGIMITFGLAIRTLVGPGMGFRELATKPRFKSTRRFINHEWADPPESEQFERLWAAVQKKDGQLKAKQIAATDPYYVSINALADELLRMAKWHVVKWWFNLLVGAMVLLIPIELGAAAFMFSRPEPGPADTTLTIKLHRDS